jgi:hypothetical protein
VVQSCGRISHLRSGCAHHLFCRSTARTALSGAHLIGAARDTLARRHSEVKRRGAGAAHTDESDANVSELQRGANSRGGGERHSEGLQGANGRRNERAGESRQR